MAEYVVDSSGDSVASGVDLVDGDAPPVRLVVHGDLPASIEHDGRTWLPSGESDHEGDAPAIAVYRPAD